MASNINICSSNARGLSDPSKRRDVLHYLRGKGYSIICLQETHFEKGCENRLRSEWGGECFISSYTSRARGVAILIQNTFHVQ